MNSLITVLFILRVALKHGVDELFVKTPILRHFNLLLLFFPWICFKRKTQKKRSRGERVRLMLIELGTIFIKLGQTLSARRDFIPDDIADELSQLQDNCPPFPTNIAREIIEKQLGQPIDKVFKNFDDQPLAAASIAQVHQATLLTGESVIVKIVRPDIESRINKSVCTMRHLANIAQRLIPAAQRIRPKEIVEEFVYTLWNETNMTREGSNASVIRRNFTGDDTVYTAKIYWKFTTEKILVMERIDGIPITNIKALEAAGLDREQLSTNGVLIFFKQVFRDNLFHADMHPGNVFVSTDGKYKAIDFGIVGSLSERDKRYLAENFIAFFNQDYHRVAQLHIDSGWVNPNTRCQDLEAAIRSICEPIMNLPLSQISFGKFLLQLFSVARQFDMEVQPQLVLFQKTLFNIEGLGRQLYPDLDLWDTAKPFLEQWLKKHYGARSLVKELRAHWPAIRQELPTLIRSRIESPKPLNVQKEKKNYLLPIGILIAGILSISQDAGNITPLLYNALPLSSGLFLLLSIWLFWRK